MLLSYPNVLGSNNLFSLDFHGPVKGQYNDLTRVKSFQVTFDKLKQKGAVLKRHISFKASRVLKLRHGTPRRSVTSLMS